MKTVLDVIGREHDLNDYSYFVTMTDRILSGWGGAEGKTAKRIILCKTLKEARIIQDGIKNCKNQNGMRYVNICTEFPKYNEKRYKISIDVFEDCSLYIEKSDIKL